MDILFLGISLSSFGSFLCFVSSIITSQEKVPFLFHSNRILTVKAEVAPESRISRISRMARPIYSKWRLLRIIQDGGFEIQGFVTVAPINVMPERGDHGSLG